jgi:ubiquinol-cytochrome c reductase cytochrome b subunit
MFRLILNKNFYKNIRLPVSLNNIAIKNYSQIFFTKLQNQNVIREHLIAYPTPVNFNYMWSFGSLAGLFFSIQLITGILLAMHYTPHIDFAFSSIEHIMRDINYGWLIRYLHANGASFFFIMVYSHIGKALYYSSYTFPYIQLWRIGIIIFLLMIIIAFMGYVSPWGQMSFWGATVITNLFTAIPYIGETIAFWLWGGFSVDNATLNRFFSLHYTLPFILIACILLHLILLHIPGSSHPLKISELSDKIAFFPYFYLKDMFSFFISLIFFSWFVFFFPNVLGHSDNYIIANPLVTPTHIVPEWYFLPFYAILRSIPDKLGGVLLMGLAIIILLVLPNIVNINFHTKNPQLRPFFKFFFWCFAINVFLLGFIGSNVVEDPYIIIGQLSTFFYFFYLIFLCNFIFFFETWCLKFKSKINN